MGTKSKELKELKRIVSNVICNALYVNTEINVDDCANIADKFVYDNDPSIQPLYTFLYNHLKTAIIIGFILGGFFATLIGIITLYFLFR